MPSKKNNLETSGAPAPKKKPLPKAYVADTPHTPSGDSVERVISYDDVLKGSRQNMRVEGFYFDKDTFENLVDSWADVDDIPIALDTPVEQLDIFCKVLYGKTYRQTYSMLRTISKIVARKCIDRLAKCGNATAVAISKTHFAQLIDDDGSKPINITIKNDLN
jgi:hypothetical protein